MVLTMGRPQHKAHFELWLGQLSLIDGLLLGIETEYNCLGQLLKMRKLLTVLLHIVKLGAILHITPFLFACSVPFIREL